MRTILQGGTVLRHDAVFKADVAIENERVVEVGEALPTAGATVVDATGCYVMPGGVDVHTHLSLGMGGEAPAADCMYVGTVAAAMGGTTCVVEHPGFAPEGASLLDAPMAVRQLAQGQAVVDYGLHTVFQPRSNDADNADWADVAEAAAAGYASGKLYRTYAAALEDAAAMRVLCAMREAGCLTTVHCENDAMVSYLIQEARQRGEKGAEAYPATRPALCEEESVFTMLALARVASTPLYVVHVSTAAALAHVRSAQAAGQPVLAETCPQYLLLHEECYAEGAAEGFKYVMAPPLRTRRDSAALWEALRDGQVEVVGSDHCPFSYADKWRLSGGDVFRCPGGAPGVETRIPLMFSEGVLKGRLTLPRFVQVVAEAPARIMGLGSKGVLEAGYDADVLVLDPAQERSLSAENLHQGTDYTPFEGMNVRGWPRHVWVRGQAVVQDGVLVAEKGCGRFVPRRLV